MGFSIAVQTEDYIQTAPLVKVRHGQGHNVLIPAGIYAKPAGKCARVFVASKSSRTK